MLINKWIKDRNYKHIEIYDKALWSTETTLKFNLSGAGGSSISKNKENTIDIKSKTIDSLKLTELDLVKFDLEGAEEEALKGMAETVKRCKPNMAICVYHKQDDLIKLPQIIKNLDSSYKLYLRQYLMTPVDTVLYALR